MRGVKFAGAKRVPDGKGMFAIAKRWEKVSDAERAQLKAVVEGLVGYPCRLACLPTAGSVDIYVWCLGRQAVCDWLELQPSGAFGLIYDEYEDADAEAVIAVEDRCEEYNDAAGVEFVSDSDSESESDSKESDQEKK